MTVYVLCWNDNGQYIGVYDNEDAAKLWGNKLDFGNRKTIIIRTILRHDP